MTDMTIGDIIRQSNSLTAEQVEAVLAHQKQTGVRFGQAAVDLGFISKEDVLWALSQQFNYPYAADREKLLGEELIVASRPFTDEAEAFRDIRSQLLSGVLSADQPRRALAVVSPNVGDGKSFFCANLAAAFSQLGGRTLLVDADMRTPRLHEVFRVQPGLGLSGILAGRSEPNVIRPVDALPSLFLLPVGVTPPNPLELVQRDAFNLLLADLVSRFDHVIVDTPAAEHGADCRVIAGKCAAALVIGRRSHTHTADLKALAASLNRPTIKLAGVVMNNH